MKYLLLISLLLPAQAYAFTTGQNATTVIGHTDFFTVGTIHSDTTRNTLYFPEGIAFDKSGNMWVADTGFNRILEYVPPFTNGENASVVIGQKDFASSQASLSPTGLNQPYGLTFDKDGNMWVADTNNNRIVEFTAPFTDGKSTSLVIGSPSFNKGIYPTSASSLAAPYGLAFDKQGNLWVVDYYDNRILEYIPPFKNGMNATLVLGQYSFTDNSDGTSSSNLNLPSSIAFDSSGNLWVTDSLNNRVMEFRYPFSNHESASLVIGQKILTTNQPGITNDTLNTPYGITFDPSGNLWVTDGNNARVLEYVPPFTNGQPASVVLGQQNFLGMHMGTSADILSEPYDAKFDNSGNLWVADTANNRVVEFKTTTVPEFGLAGIVLAASMSVLVIVSAKTR
jgi:sugar lactone lactonase YvrE